MTERVGGVSRGAFPWMLVHAPGPAKRLVLLPDDEDVEGFADDVRALFRIPGWPLPKESLVAAYPADDEPLRQVSLHDWLFGKVDILVATPESLAQPCDLADTLRRRTIFIKPGLTMTRPVFEEALGSAGYTRNDHADGPGEYAIRGDVTDIWPAAAEGPVRVTWNFDTVEALRVIDQHSQLSTDYLRELRVHPMSAGEGAALPDVVPSGAGVWAFGAAAGAWKAGRDATLTEVLPGAADAGDQGFAPPPLFAGKIAALRDQLVQWHQDDWRVVIFCHNEGERDRLDELLEDRLTSARGQNSPWMPPMVVGPLEHGFIHPTQRIAVLANSEIFGRYRKRVRLPKFEGAGDLKSMAELKGGDYLVHEKHGVGRYQGLKPLKVGGVTSEYLSIEYKGGDRLYVPIFEIQQVQKYFGAEGKRPQLSSLDAATWERICSKVKEDVAKLAADLLRKAAKRSVRPGFAFPPPTHLEKEFAESFVYELTPDQKKSWEEIESDMMAPRSMDRLLCGDVGFGKTEIAMRATLKAALAARQVAVLCPTTILAEQHARNFADRFADYPVTVKLLSRFQDKAEQKAVMEGLAKGAVDVVIGTHRLLSKDIAFRNLGLVVIDEEHRFGVKQKSRLLALRETVDVLSLTATPIPRTLASSLGGIKDLSVIETAPAGRLPISTHVGLFDEDVMVRAVQAELDRGGQVFYVHNRVKTLEARKTWLEGLMPSIRIGMAHGQMDEKGLEEVMHGFLHKKIDILLATTIIESGLDIPSVNTLIVEEAEEMGLAQLYQLRGRVGRSKMRAFCYLFYNSPAMSTDARKRLDALKEFTSLGSGLRLAMRDMEIRGAGNLLGPQQHGNVAAVGIETYAELLNEEIHKLKGEPVPPDETGPKLELSVSAYLPEEYVPSETERVQLYKRILGADAAGLGGIEAELRDRCGTPSEPVRTLFEMARLRLSARAAGLDEVHEEAETLLVLFRVDFKMPDATLKRLLEPSAGVQSWVPGERAALRFLRRAGEPVLETLSRFLGVVARPG